MVIVEPLWIDNGDGPVRNPNLTEEEYNTGIQQLIAQNTSQLWEAAHIYEYSEISGSAVGLLTIGVSQNKPKCVAVMAWIQSIWNLYYLRKPTVTYLFDSTLNDFSSCGPIPYTVPELMEEALG